MQSKDHSMISQAHSTMLCVYYLHVLYDLVFLFFHSCSQSVYIITKRSVLSVQTDFHGCSDYYQQRTQGIPCDCIWHTKTDSKLLCA